MDRYTLLHFKWITNKDLLLNYREFCSMLCGSLDGRGVWGRIDTCICVAESLHSSPKTTTALLIGGTVVKNLPANAETEFDPWVGKIPWRREWQLTPVFLPGKSHRQKKKIPYT